MPTDIPMSPKRLEARRLNTMCDPSIHQESIEEEDEEGDVSDMKTDTGDQHATPPVSSHLLRPEELTRQFPSKTGVASTLHIPTPDSKLIRRGPGYSELSPIPENSSNEKSEMLHHLVNRIEQAVKSMGQEADDVGGQGILKALSPTLSSSVSVPSDNSNNFPSSYSMVTSASSDPEKSSACCSIENPNLSNSPQSPPPPPSSSSVQDTKSSITTTSEMIKATTSSSLQSSPSFPQPTSFPSPSAILLSSSIMAAGSSRSDSERNSSTNSSHNGSDIETESPMTGDEPECPVNPDSYPLQTQLSSREEKPMEAENGGGDSGGRNRVAIYAEEVASGILAMDGDFKEENEDRGMPVPSSRCRKNDTDVNATQERESTSEVCDSLENNITTGEEEMDSTDT